MAICCRHLRVLSRRAYHAHGGVFGYPGKANSLSLAEEVIGEGSGKPGAYSLLINAYRNYGHRFAELDPLCSDDLNGKIEFQQILLKKFCVDANDIVCGSSQSPDSQITVSQLCTQLSNIYCSAIGAEFMHLQSAHEREWFAKRIENLNCSKFITDEERLKYAELMIKSQSFDNFVATKFPTVKRYGAEGAEPMLVFFWELLRHSSLNGICDIVVGIAHRGRLNLLTTLLHFPPVLMFRKMMGKLEFGEDTGALGDVLSHLTSSINVDYTGKPIHVTMLPNPSHLEAVNGVALGKTRGRMSTLGKADYNSSGATSGEGVLCVQVHGDAALVGQGVNQECLAMSQCPHFRVGGSIHLVTNNQLGFTTGKDHGRSSTYITCVAKMANSPIIHVNGNNPELLALCTRLAVDYRNTFEKDIFVDLVCYRKHGHNEIDEPRFTQPIIYRLVDQHPGPPNLYTQQLMDSGILTKDTRNKWTCELKSELQTNFELLDKYQPAAPDLKGNWSGFSRAGSHIEEWDTGVEGGMLKWVAVKSVQTNENLTVHPHLLKTHCQNRIKQATEGAGIDWATAEAMAIGSLLYQDVNVRISGQDVGRGTFSHRHCMLVDQDTDQMYIPLNDLKQDQKAFLEVANSILSEEAVLGFEYGMSVENPNRLVLWEAQFGDFFNGAQIIIDTFISSGESKWLYQSGLVMLLPHGFDGAGPEHSSCKMERFLQLSDSSETCVDGDNVNMHIVHPTTSAQYFHLLRRQILRNYRKPLIVVAPKILLRFGGAACSLSEFLPGTGFKPVIGDASAEKNNSSVSKVIFCCGKHYYALDKERKARALTNIAIVRLEALCPFPALQLRSAVQSYKNCADFLWSQEEPRNAGPWSFVKPRFENLLGIKLNYGGRRELPVAATLGEKHILEHENVITDTFQ